MAFPIVRFIATTKRALPHVLPLLRHPRGPFWMKAAAVALGLLIVSPLDLFGDIPVLGLLDDAVLLALLVVAFVGVAGKFAAPSDDFERPLKRATPVLPGFFTGVPGAQRRG